MVGEKHIGHDSKYRYVYLISNKVNGKTYVGQHTTEDLNDNYFGSGLLLKRAIKKYGKENFLLGYLVFCSTIDELNDQEKIWIDYFKRHKTKDNYNIADGGYNWQTKEINLKSAETRRRKIKEGIIVPWNKGKKGIYSQEYRLKISKAKLGTIQTKEANEKRRKTQTGRKRPKEVVEKIVKTKKENPKNYTKEERQKIREVVIEFNSKNMETCPWCHKRVNPLNAKVWHFDNCKDNPNSTKTKYCCPHCNKSSVNKAMMMRWHFDNCKLK